MKDWKFNDPKNLAVITTKRIIDNLDWIGYVSHDVDDGAWQFISSNQLNLEVDNALVVSLESIIDLDPSIEELADLPIGWHAWRKTKDSPWLRVEDKLM